MVHLERMMNCIWLCLILGVAAGPFESLDSGEAKLPPRSGTLCKLLSREVITDISIIPAVHRLRFSLPGEARMPECCDGEGGMLHVRVKAPDASGQTMRLNPYSAHIDSSNQSFDLLVKIYPGEPPSHPGVSGYLGTVDVGEYVHIPEIRALDWRRDSKRAGFICFGVGITECLGAATDLLEAGAEVRMLYANRNAGDQFLLDELRALLVKYPGMFRLRHCLSRPAPGSVNEPGPSTEGERTTHGRVDFEVLKEEFGGEWQDGGEVKHFLFIGTPLMEQSVLGMIARAQLYDFSTLRGHPPFLLIKGPYGNNSGWEALSPPEDSGRAVELDL